MLQTLLILIFIRPFISSLAFPYLNFIYSVFLIGFLFILTIAKGIPLKKIQALKHPLLLFCLALIISVTFSSSEINSLKEIYKYVSGLLMLLVAASLTYEDRSRVIKTVVIAGFFISLLAIYQYFFGFQHILNYMVKEKISDSFALDYLERKRAFFPFITPNTLAGYLIMIIPLVLINKKRTWFIIPISFALLLTKSLGAFLSIFLALGIYFYLQGKLEKRKVLFLFGTLVIIGLIFIVRSATPKEHLKPIFSTMMRFNYWKETLIIIKAHPLSGVGIGNFDLIQSCFTHNSYLQIWAEMGILGIFALLWVILESLKAGFKKLIVTRKQDTATICLLSANLAFLAHNFIDFTFFLPEINIVWWVLFGLLCSS